MKRNTNAPTNKKPGQEKAGTISRRTDTTADHDPQSGHQFGGQLSKKVIKAEDQLHLSEEELNVEVDRILEGTNPNAPENIVRFNHEDRTFKFEHTVEQAAFHFADDGFLILKDGPEAKLQKEENENKRELLKKKLKEQANVETDNLGADDIQQKKDILRNQFNYSDREVQTFNYPFKEVEIMTEPPAAETFEATATQWEIHDFYQQHFEELKKQNGKGNGGGKNKKANRAKTPQEIIHSKEMISTLKLMERMLNQNSMEEILHDYKYWDDPSDDVVEDKKRRTEGSLLPLWRFPFPDKKKLSVTGVCWNPKYSDLFAVSYGSYNFLKQGGGMICCYTLKNPGIPEYTFYTESGAMCLDFHPKHPSLLAVGLYDGTCLIFDIKQKDSKPLILSTVKSGKHNGVVWQVKWETEGISTSLSFFSVSSDGRVTNWTLSKNELQYTDIMHLKLESSSTVAFDSDKSFSANASFTQMNPSKITEDFLVAYSGGTCFDFNPKTPHLFIVGTEEGKIHLCSKAYNSQYIRTYDGHNMNVYSVKWNNFHPNVFLSASADWNVKLWDMNYTQPLMTFDLGSGVGDIDWAPFSSTVFCAVTDDGRVQVFDLSVNKRDSLTDACSLIVKKAKLTHVQFNPVTQAELLYDSAYLDSKNPQLQHKAVEALNRMSFALLVGDDKGLVQTLKLSPNLRRPPDLKDKEAAPAAGQQQGAKKTEAATTTGQKTVQQMEIDKLTAILEVALKQQQE
ncbi:hypothetical protein C9374_006620 [Naegleria lovaniensis]|uniref:Dynein intermediate chain n=1 Tax=Naegleria lovaniensis TaxID=51637 RepID=A0AA88GJ25_NAELO|nr:uncharacterized protein C9374_006620 [Naegleria lovaniensis]KAG2379503.1 hypothetical protein C9374_006620 [Naegleria lovaniensis]